MKIISKYVADDGAEFETQLACIQYEEFCAKIDNVKRILPEVELNDGTYLQLDREKFLAYQRALVNLFVEAHPGMADEHVRWALTADRPAGLTLIGRYMDDAGPRPLYGAWWRVMCVDRQFRQWSQPYYATRADSCG